VPAAELRCAGCGARAEEPYPFRCPAASPGDDIDHLIARAAPPEVDIPTEGDDNPFIRYRRLQYSWDLATERGMSDGDYVALVQGLDDRVADVDGGGFRITPYSYSDELAVWIKDETSNVSGSHKGRHLMGIAIYLEVAEQLGLVSDDDRRRPLAIASCGNAALAAAVVARAAERHLQVFIPTWADAGVVARLEELGAEIVVCERRDQDPAGDPSYLRFAEAIDGGALPFSCQGPQNGLTIDGGMTLGFEIATQHRGDPIEELFIQVGGGALGSATWRGLEWAYRRGALEGLPRLHTVQTTAVQTLVWAFANATEDGRADLRHRSRYMRPVTGAPTSIATGILDDETYDWAVLIDAMQRSGGRPVIAFEETLAQARDRGRAATGIQVSATGAAGLAGVMSVRDDPTAGPVTTVLFTGIQR
jgi:threonine synthase